MFPRRAMLPFMTSPLLNMFKDVDLFTLPGDAELIRCTQDKDKLEVRFRWEYTWDIAIKGLDIDFV